MKSIVKAAQDLLDALNRTASVPVDVSTAANALSDALHEYAQHPAPVTDQTPLGDQERAEREANPLSSS